MRYDSIDVKVWQEGPGHWRGHYWVIRDRQVVAEGDAPGDYETQREAEWNTKRAGERAAG